MHKSNVLPRLGGMYSGGIVNWRVAAVHAVAKLVGLTVHLEGFPLGTHRNIDMEELERSSVCGSLRTAQGEAITHHQMDAGFKAI